MQLHIVTGFLGSGKTTAIKGATIALLKENIPVAVITNDQGTRLVDGDLFQALGIRGKQVGGGCFCCNYNELDKSIRELVEGEAATVLFAEAVGSCTDIIATVLKPLQKFHPEITVTVSTFTDVRLLRMMLEGNHSFDESVAYIYLKQLEEAEIIVINKTDLVNSGFAADVKKILHERFPGKQILFQQSLRDEDILQWINVLDNYQRNGVTPSLDVDYDVYAEGEAKMTWYDQQLEVYAQDNDAPQIAQDIINSIYAEIARLKVPTGHVKFLVNETTKVSFTGNNEEPVKLELRPASNSTLLINIRVQETPTVIEDMVEEVLERFRHKCNIQSTKAEAFSPGYPRPVFRM